jgi:hypothetical protein
VIVKVSRTTASLALSLALLAGCGGSDSDDGDAAVPQPSAAATAGSTSQPGGGTSTGVVNPAPSASASASAATGSAADPASPGVSSAAVRKATELVNAGILIADDLPGFVNTPVVPGPDADRTEEELYRCLRVAQAVYVARNPGREWVKGPVQVTSSADAFKSAKAAKQDMNASKSGLAPGCFTEVLQAKFAPPGTSALSSNNRVPVTVSGADDAFAIEISFTVSGTQDPKKYTGYLIGAVTGAVRVNVLYVHTDGTKPALADASKLVGSALARVKDAQKG